MPLSVFVIAVLFNYPWELLQSPLYQGTGDFGDTWWHCFVASLGDGLLVLLIFGIGWVALRRQDWFEKPGRRGYLAMLSAGLAIAVGIEWWAVHIAGSWAYTPRMPLVPGLRVGIVPIAQMLVLPPLIFRVVSTLRRRTPP